MNSPHRQPVAGSTQGIWQMEQRVFRRYRRWSKAGLSTGIFEEISGEAAMIDGSIVKVHRHGQGAKGGPESGHRYIQRRYS